MSEIELTLNTIGKEIQKKIDLAGGRDSGYFSGSNPKYQHISGRKLTINEVAREGLHDVPVQGALKLTYCQGRFLLVDRIVKDPKKDKFKKLRRILFFFKDKSGQISSSILLELLKIDENKRFSKHDLIRSIDEQYFLNNGITISSGDINEVFSRMIRHTFSDFFAIEGRNFVKKNYLLKIEEVTLKQTEKYEMYRSRINEKTYNLVNQLNTSPMISIS